MNILMEIKENANRVGLWIAIITWALIILVFSINELTNHKIALLWVLIPSAFTGLTLGIVTPIKYGRTVLGIDFWLGLVLNSLYTLPSLLLILATIFAVFTGATT